MPPPKPGAPSGPSPPDSVPTLPPGPPLAPPPPRPPEPPPPPLYGTAPPCSAAPTGATATSETAAAPRAPGQERRVRCGASSATAATDSATPARLGNRFARLPTLAESPANGTRIRRSVSTAPRSRRLEARPSCRPSHPSPGTRGAGPRTTSYAALRERSCAAILAAAEAAAPAGSPFSGTAAPRGGSARRGVETGAEAAARGARQVGPHAPAASARLRVVGGSSLGLIRGQGAAFDRQLP